MVLLAFYLFTCRDFYSHISKFRHILAFFSFFFVFSSFCSFSLFFSSHARKKRIYEEKKPMVTSNKKNIYIVEFVLNISGTKGIVFFYPEKLVFLPVLRNIELMNEKAVFFSGLCFFFPASKIE